MLDFVNIPSKRDVRELKARLDHLNGQMVNLSMKIDRMLAEKHPKTTATRRSIDDAQRRQDGAKSSPKKISDRAVMTAQVAGDLARSARLRGS